MQQKVFDSMTDANSRGSWSDSYLPSGGEVSQPGQASDGIINLATIRGLLFRQRFILIGVTALILVIGLALTLITKPLYKASATVRVDTQKADIIEGQSLTGAVPGIEFDRAMKTQAVVIQSKKTAYKVVDALDLAKNDAFLGQAFEGGRPSGVTEKQWMRQRREVAASIAQGGVTVDIPGDSRIVTINFTSPNPQVASLLANGYVDAFVKEDLTRAVEANDYARAYLQDQIQKVGQKLQSSEKEANAYAKANGIVGGALGGSEGKSTSGTAQTITAANLTSVNETYTKLRADRIAAEQRWLAIAKVSPSQLPEAQGNSALQAMVAERGKLVTSLAELRQRYGENYPQVRETKAQLAAIETQIGRMGADIKNAIRDQYEVALRQEQGLASELQNVAGQTMDEQDRRVQYNLLDREAGALRTQLASLLDRYNQLTAASNLNSNTITKLDAAETPGAPSSPNLMKNMLLAGVLGLGLAAALAVIRETFDDRLRSSDDVERKLGAPMLGFTPHLMDDEIAGQLADPFSALMEAYSSLRTSIDFAVPGESRILQITSSQPSEGKSLTSSILARKYAQLGRKTLLIDSDLRKPTINHLFETKRSTVGFAEVLLGDIELHDALIKGTPENLDVLPVGSIPASPVELLSSQRLTDFLAWCRMNYALVIIDSSPVMGLADAPLISRHVDGVIFIVEANRSHFGQAKMALRRLRSAGARIAGAVLTKYRSADAGLSYDYVYNYYSYGNDKKD